MKTTTFVIEADEILTHKWEVEAENEETAIEAALEGCPLPDGECESSDFTLKSIDGRPLPAPVALSFTSEEWTEISEACRSKAFFIRRGEYGPENKRGEDKRWVADLEAIADRIETEADL